MNKESAVDIEKVDLKEFSTLEDENNTPEEGNKKKNALKFVLYFSLILILTGLALFLSLYQDFDGVVKSLSRANWRYLLVILGLVLVTYLLDGFIIFIFSRLYTRKYKYHQGLATSMVGAFYSAVTPGASGGQVMQTFTMKKQGIATSNGASIMIMSFIVYQLALILLGSISMIFSAGDLIRTVGSFTINFKNFTLSIPAIPLTIIGFALNVIVILGLFLLSYSRWFHNLIMHYGIDFLAKLKIIKNPDQKREELRVQVENFKIELRRLLSNIPVLILVFVCFTLILIIRFSIPFFAGLALDGYGYRLNIDGTLVTNPILDAAGNVIGATPVMSTGGANIESFWQCVFLSSYHQMATGLIPLPGSAGVSEYFFNIMFNQYFKSQQTTAAAQIIWRFATFHIVVLIAGIVSATYRSSPKNEIHHANRKTFVTMQLETIDERRESSNTMFETAALSRKEIQARLRNYKMKNIEYEDENKPNVNEETVSNGEETSLEVKPVNEAKHTKHKHKEKEIEYDEIMGDDE